MILCGVWRGLVTEAGFVINLFATRHSLQGWKAILILKISGIPFYSRALNNMSFRLFHGMLNMR